MNNFMIDKGYIFYLDGILVPITPSSITTKINNKNKVVTLINDGDFNILKEEGLKEFTFDMCLPAYKYPFARGVLLPINYYLNMLSFLKNSKKPFRFIVIREGAVGSSGYNTTILVSLENYEIKEDAGNGRDVVVSVTLKEYKNVNSTLFKYVNIGAQAIGAALSVATFISTKTRDSSSKKSQRTYKVKEGDTLYIIAKKELGDANKCNFLKELNKLNSIHDIRVGQVIRLE
ncbi:LysM peptidoglycan-binding domain-containing protein [Fusobacterium polymorphum]|uniref:LysM peptidoglycan-binding domain-containing protein n=1 Tax=Fusobacterium nucleatum subsp. polymorphum TaxID=76857 RepID=UPI0030CFD630